jgi:hypothetical protein
METECFYSLWMSAELLSVIVDFLRSVSQVGRRSEQKIYLSPISHYLHHTIPAGDALLIFSSKYTQ